MACNLDNVILSCEGEVIASKSKSDRRKRADLAAVNGVLQKRGAHMH